MAVTDSEKRSLVQVFWKHKFNIAGLLFALITAISSLTRTGDSWPVAVLSITFFIIGNIDSFESLKAGPGGFEAKIKQKLEEARDTIDELNELALLFGKTTIGNIVMMGRWDGFSDEQKEKMIPSIVDYYKKN